MKRTGWRRRWAAIAAASLAVAAVCGPVAAAGAAPATGPQVKLIAAQNSSPCPGTAMRCTWIRHLGRLTRFRVRARRAAAGLPTPLTVTQIVHLPGGGTRQIAWPASVVGKVPTGLRDFVT